MEAISATVSPAAAREAASSLPRLTPGQVVNARVTRVEGASVELRLGQHTLHASSRVPLEVGDQVQLEVQRSATGGILLKMVDDSRSTGGPRQPTTAPAGPGPTGLPGGQPARAETGPAALTRPGSGPTSQAGLDTPTPLTASGLPQAAAASVRTYERLSSGLARLAAAPLPRAAGAESTGARSSAPLAGSARSGSPTGPANLLGLLADLGLPADPATLSLVEELVRQGAPLGADAIRTLRRQLATLGGSPADARSLALLSRLGLPATPRALELVRLLLAGGQQGVQQSWGEALVQLEQLARAPSEQSGDAAPALAQRALQAWQAPGEAEPAVLARWLRATLQETAIPTEARLALLADGRPDLRLDQDARVRLAGLLRAVEQAPAGRAEARQALDRLQSAIQAEQLLNSARLEPREPRFFVFTLPTAQPERRGTLELAVREREPGQPGAAGRADYLRLRLDLPNLGQVRVNLTVSQPSLSCHFAAKTPFVSALLQASADELLAGFRRLGYRQASVDAAVEAAAPDPLWAPADSPGRVHRVDLRA